MFQNSNWWKIRVALATPPRFRLYLNAKKICWSLQVLFLIVLWVAMFALLWRQKWLSIGWLTPIEILYLFISNWQLLLHHYIWQVEMRGMFSFKFASTYLRFCATRCLWILFMRKQALHLNRQKRGNPLTDPWYSSFSQKLRQSTWILLQVSFCRASARSTDWRDKLCLTLHSSNGSQLAINSILCVHNQLPCLC